jgi:adenosylcobalamin-dependent ribonucleoside-diphosphate reductase
MNELSRKIFLDRYALKEVAPSNLVLGEPVIVITDTESGKRDIGTVCAISEAGIIVSIEGMLSTHPLRHIERPLEDTPDVAFKRIARAIASVEKPERQAHWQQEFEAIMQDFKFVPGGRILAGAGNPAALTLQNCFVLESPHDSRGGIFKTLGEMAELMSRGGGVGINVSSLRPRYAYVKGVNGRSSGAVSWMALYSYVTGLIEQAGCFGANSRISTDKGLIRAEELVNRVRGGETIGVHTHKGCRNITDTFINGNQMIYRVTTKRGYAVDVTMNHKMVTIENGELALKPLSDMCVGDTALILLGEPHNDYDVPLSSIAYEKTSQSTHLNTDVLLPNALNEELAYYIGYTFGNGCIVQNKGLSASIPNDKPAIRDRITSAIQHLFNLTPSIEPGDGECTNVVAFSRVLIEWLRQNGLLKHKADQIRVPESIFQSSSTVALSFVAGYFDADGCNRGSKGGYGIDSISIDMLRDVQQILSANGIVSHLTITRRAKEGWEDIGRLIVSGRVFRQRFVQLVPACKCTSVDRGYEGTTYPLAMYDALHIQDKYRQRVFDRSAGRVSYSAIQKIERRVRADHKMELADKLSEMLHYAPDEIARIEPIGKCPTYDFEVDEVHMLSGSGVYTSNSRRGALMLMMNDYHPDIFEFIRSKNEQGKVVNANISVGLSDRFMKAVAEDAHWHLEFPDTTHPSYDAVWKGDIVAWKEAGYPVILYRTIKARELWDAIVQSAWASAEPGVVFLERANKRSNSWYYNRLVCVNPCAEQILPEYGVCNLGAINLSKFYDAELETVAWDALAATIARAVRFLDNVIDVTGYFLDENEARQKGERRIGLSTMGLAELLIQLKIIYGAPESIDFIDELYKFITIQAYNASISLALEKGAFPRFQETAYLQSKFVEGLPRSLQAMIRLCGIRNVTILTSAPTGTTATMADTSTGIEPFFSFKNYRVSRVGGMVEQYAAIAEQWYRAHPGKTVLPDYFISAQNLTPEAHVRVQAAIQRWNDSGISKTANVPNDWTVEQVSNLYRLMYDLDCAGGTVYRDGSRTMQVLLTNPCPDCKVSQLVVEDGCSVCHNCGYSVCNL